MDEVYKFLKENPIFYVATMDGDQPRALRWTETSRA